MLHQISWLTYLVAILIAATTYYTYVGITFYKAEVQALLYRLTGKKPLCSQLSEGDFPIPQFSITGATRQDDVDFVAQEDLFFAPPEEPGIHETPELLRLPDTRPHDNQLVSDFSEIITEVKTLVRVINESSESKENFEMLFRLIVQKYNSLAGTSFEEQVNDYLIDQGTEQFPFSLTLPELQAYWIIENNKN